MVKTMFYARCRLHLTILPLAKGELAGLGCIDRVQNPIAGLNLEVYTKRERVVSVNHLFELYII